MGRGGRAQTPLTLSAFTPPPDPRWLTLFRRFEQAAFHKDGGASCSILDPLIEPSFILVNISKGDDGTAVHKQHYFVTPQHLLTELVSAIRTSTRHRSFVLEYKPSDSAFEYIDLTDCGLILDYVPADVPRSKHRGKRLQTIAAANHTTLSNTYSDDNRFISVSKEDGKFQLDLLDSFKLTATYLAYLSIASNGFVNFYDLDVSDQPIPIRIGLTYTAEDGSIHQFVEPI